MKNKIQILLICLLLCGCFTTTSENDINALNGYWEIDYVVLADNVKKQYNFNQNIDFFELKGMEGVRKKVQPQINGHFIASKDLETFRLQKENDSLRIYYKTPHTSWKETIISINTDQLIIKNEQGNYYYYKPYKKIIL